MHNIEQLLESRKHLLSWIPKAWFNAWWDDSNGVYSKYKFTIEQVEVIDDLIIKIIWK